jgi:acetoin utilization deacetylase AcuC-like enzyme
MTDMIKEVAADTCSGRIVSVLEGGYNPEALAVCVVDHVHALTKIDLDSDFVDFQ